MARRRIEWLFVVGVLGVALFIAAIAGLRVFMSVTATPLHPNLQQVPVSGSGGELTSRWSRAVDEARQVALAGLVDQNLPGLSVAVAVGNDLVWAEGLGWADLEQRVPVTPDTQFRIGSASKALTSAGVGLLLDRGRLALDEPIQTYVPAYAKKQWPVTVRQLMGHVSGIRRDAGDEENVWAHCGRTLDGLKRFADAPLRFEPGTQYYYSNYGWILVSAAVESAAEQSFPGFMRDEVFAPLGMRDTRLDSGAEAGATRAVYYFPRFAADPRYGLQDPEEWDFSCFSGASAFLSTASDLVRLAMAMGNGRLLTPATVTLLQTSQRLSSGADTGYGLGWDLETVDFAGQQTSIVGYDGELRGGTVMSWWTFPAQGSRPPIIVAALSNTSFADMWPLALKIAEAFARGPNP